MMSTKFGKFQIAKIFGVPILLDWTILIVCVGFAIRCKSVVIGLVASVVLFLSVLLHELGHTAVALSYGCRVRDITLLLTGGRATLVDMPRGPWREAWMAAAGPLVSFVLAFLGFLISSYAAAKTETLAGDIVEALSSYLMIVNLMLGCFNLLPAFPMDGGRIFRALLAVRLGRRKATVVSYRVAQVLAAGMAIYALFDHFNFILIIIAYSIFTSATAEYTMVLMSGDGPGEDSVIISPPPYGKNKDVADIYKER